MSTESPEVTAMRDILREMAPRIQDRLLEAGLTNAVFVLTMYDSEKSVMTSNMDLEGVDALLRLQVDSIAGKAEVGRILASGNLMQ